MTRRQLAGDAEIAAALAAGEVLRLVLLRRGAPALAQAIAAIARARGIAVIETTANDLRRMSRTPAPCEVLALLGPDPDATLDAVMARPGCAWLLVDVAYPGNAGFAIRSAEVSGAEAIFLDVAMDAEGQRQALRASMYADRFFPVQWLGAETVLDAARRAQRRVVAIEDSGKAAPWEADLCGPVLFVIGGETRGIPAKLLARCDEVLRIPMAGFIPAYNLQAAMAAVAVERLRQCAGS
jgi:TrmH family RNA methyltransferase